MGGVSHIYERFTTVDKRDCSSLPLICSCNFFLTVLKHIYYLMNNIYTQTLEISFQTSKQFINCILNNLNYHTAIKKKLISICFNWICANFWRGKNNIQNQILIRKSTLDSCNFLWHGIFQRIFTELFEMALIWKCNGKQGILADLQRMCFFAASIKTRRTQLLICMLYSDPTHKNQRLSSNCAEELSQKRALLQTLFHLCNVRFTQKMPKFTKFI